MDKLTTIDGSSLIYSACYNVSVKESSTDDFSKYRDTLDYYIDSILNVTKADKYIIFGDGSTSYRKKMFDTFKADREVKKQYVKFKYDLLEYARTKWEAFNHPELESDDMCLITHNQYKDEYDITIAAIDGDLRQEAAKFFNYGIFRKKDYRIEDGFEIITPEQAEFNLWRQVLIKGHNNKLNYLEGCGEGTAESYLKKFSVSQYKFAVLKAYIEGIPKQDGIKRVIDGYGLNKGIDEFNKSFKQTYLFRNSDELTEFGISFEIPEFKTRMYGGITNSEETTAF
ncbi:MAG: hypothetical protein M0R17_04770 [Candidatus Omnitrophica bacterium]|jgi:hypothetical protein|nr:hypothetical protein [Candidatus Omnitrophota bacterium]